MSLRDLREELDLVARLIDGYERLSHLRAFPAPEGPLKATPAPEAVFNVQSPGDPRPAQGRPIPDGPQLRIPMRQVQGPVGPGDDGVRMEADLSQADSLIAQQLTAVFDRENPKASDVERQSFLGSLPIRIQETKDQLQAMISGAVQAARDNPEAQEIRAQVKI